MGGGGGTPPERGEGFSSTQSLLENTRSHLLRECKNLRKRKE